MNSENTALTIPQRAAVALNSTKTEAELYALVKSSADINEVKDGAGREQCHRLGMNLKNARITIEKTRKTACEDAQAFSKGCIAEEKRLVAIITPEEDRIFALRDTYDARVEAEKQAKIAAERARIARIESLIYAIRDFPRRLMTEDARPLIESLPVAIEEYERCEPSVENYEDFVPQAKAAVVETLAALRTLWEKEQVKVAAETAERERREAEEKRLVAERGEMALQKAELDRVAAEQATEKKRLEDAAKAQREEDESRQMVAAESKRQLEAQQAAIAAARAKLDADEAAAKVAREAAELLASDYEKALVENAAFDALRLEKDHAEAMEMDVMFAAQSEAMEMNALLDANTEPTDEQIIKAYMEAFGGTEEEATTRLMRFGGKK